MQRCICGVYSAVQWCICGVFGAVQWCICGVTICWWGVAGCLAVINALLQCGNLHPTNFNYLIYTPSAGEVQFTITLFAL